jgi:sulfatase modifying factor 1
MIDKSLCFLSAINSRELLPNHIGYKGALMRTASPILLLALVCSALPALAQAPPDYDFQWRTVGAPGNAPANPADFPFEVPPNLGSVNYEFRMATTEVTNGQYFEFVQAYTTVHPNVEYSPVFTGDYIVRHGNPGAYTWTMSPDVTSLPVCVGWNYAAIYANWLCNGKAVSAAAFASGAYDTSTFYPNSDQPQLTHSPGAQFWLASIDEWSKAMYYDPNKNGPGQAGYWRYETRTDTVPVGGVPGSPGAQTGAGTYVEDPNNISRLYPVGSYPNAASPWGILDGSGGMKEWTEGDGSFEFRWLLGSQNTNPDPTIADRIGSSLALQFYNPGGGIRLVSVVPTPGTGVLFFGGLGLFLKRRRR